MRRGSLVVLMVLAFAVAAAAQAPAQIASGIVAVGGPAADLHASAEDVVARLMSFDRNGDGMLAGSELPERMVTVVAAGDSNKDGALNRDEIRVLADESQRPIAIRGFVEGSYGFDQSSQSSRRHINGALEDLRLASVRQKEAQAIVTAFVDDLEQQAASELLDAVQPVLTGRQLEFIADALNNQGQISVLPVDESGRMLLVVSSLNQRPVTLVALGFDVNADQAVKRYTERIKFTDDADRAVLLAQLKDTLTDDERDDYRAALERRPIVKAGVTVINGVAVLGQLAAVSVR